MRNIAIIGFGVLGKQILNLIKGDNPISKVIVFDDKISNNDKIVDSVFPMNRYLEEDFKQFEFYLGIGYKHLIIRNDYIEKLIKAERNVSSFIHSSCFISPYSIIRKGCILFPKCNIDQGVEMGYGNILHNSVTISHDSIIGKCNYFSPSVTLCGNITIGEGSFIGAGTTIADGIIINDFVRIGIASCITKNINSNLSVIGNPQRILTNQLFLK